MGALTYLTQGPCEKLLFAEPIGPPCPDLGFQGDCVRDTGLVELSNYASVFLLKGERNMVATIGPYDP